MRRAFTQESSPGQRILPCHRSMTVIIITEGRKKKKPSRMLSEDTCCVSLVAWVQPLEATYRGEERSNRRVALRLPHMRLLCTHTGMRTHITPHHTPTTHNWKTFWKGRTWWWHLQVTKLEFWYTAGGNTKWHNQFGKDGSFLKS